MEINAEHTAGVTVVTLNGSLDALSAPHAIDYLEKQINEGHTQLIMNLADVDYMSSAGVRCILNTLKLSRQAGGDLRMVNIPAPIEKVLDMGGVISILKTYPDTQAALESFAS